MIVFHGESFSGRGIDVDGEFDLAGEYDPGDDAVSIVRTYISAPRNPDQVGYPFIYIGRWDGYQISGRWMMSSRPAEGGAFEMWPEDEEVPMPVLEAEEALPGQSTLSR